MVATLLADLFESHRGHLLAVAYRLTGSVADAEDAVQESWLRLAGASQSEIEDLRAWLTTVVSRLCLDRLRSAAARRENYVGQWLPEPVVTPLTGPPGPDPLAAVVQRQEFRMAALVVLDQLTPPQRVAFVLHEGLQVPYGEIAGILDITPEAARQLAARARKVVREQTPPVAADGEHAAAVQKLVVALGTGDARAVAAVLHPDAKMIGDSGGTTQTARNVIFGPAKVARLFLGLIRRYGLDRPGVDFVAENVEFVRVNGQLGVLVHARPGDGDYPGFPSRVLGFTVVDGMIQGAYDHANPAKLGGVRLN
ncbi:RNA polymerase sigma factor SigJ [Nocardia sienata]|uniref:RNA polymerase sigma factor SigJ n=1 Tax=Nocardia sienata TaxID=248552 RepID=UPI0007A41DE7|nr:RNA polymerase sigma factor SigJ [Nocardia sienata]